MRVYAVYVINNSIICLLNNVLYEIKWKRSVSLFSLRKITALAKLQNLQYIQNQGCDIEL